MRAGERGLGREFFEEEAGYFWGILETRPYMRARAGFAVCLWDMGENGRAIEHFRELLRLNPNDNQGNRYLLARLLLEEGRDEELGALLKEYKDEASAEWLYTGALWRFRREGNSRRASRALQQGFAANVFVPLFLLEMRPVPLERPQYISRGEESEAVDYVLGNGSYWFETTGAMEWCAEEFARALEEVEKRVRDEENEEKLRRLMGD